MLKERTHIFVLGGLLLLLVLTGIATYLFLAARHNAVPPETQNLFQQAEIGVGGYAYVDINGNPRALEEFLGKVLLVSSWAGWSPYSVTDLPMLNALASEFDPEQVVVVALNRKETINQAQRFLNTLPALGSLVIIVDTDDRFYLTNGGYAMPETVLYDQQGKITAHWRGQVKGDEMRSAITPLLNQD